MLYILNIYNFVNYTAITWGKMKSLYDTLPKKRVLCHHVLKRNLELCSAKY